jgi:isoleucyl-tRNA synthetase
MARIPDVGNPWLDAGIVSFSTQIDPKTHKVSYATDKKYWREWFPADFITESFPGQFKNWFYSLIAMATVLENEAPFKTVLGFGTLVGEDGRPMHKSWGNAIEFNEGADKIGVDVMRWLYCLAEPSRNLLFGYKLADETRRRFHLILWNVYKFFVTYANLNKLKAQSSKLKATINLKLLDRWIVSRLNQLIKLATQELDNYNHHKAAEAIEAFVVNDLSLWYVRRSRESKENLSTLYQVLIELTKILAPFNPFISEEIFKNLTNEESVHLTAWPAYNEKEIDKKLEKQMQTVRDLCAIFHSRRKEQNIKVRIPVRKVAYKAWERLAPELENLIREEGNIYELKYQKSTSQDLLEIEADFSKSNLDEEAGEAREIIRKIQMERKKLRCSLNEWLEVTLPSWPLPFTEEIKRKTITKKLIKGNQFAVKIIKG